jgi:pyruvate, orthophosphate dikinase
MVAASHWPKHFYLIASGNPVHRRKPERDQMGSKAFNLQRMDEIGLPVPPALVIGTYFTQTPDQCMAPLFSLGLDALQQAAGLVFGSARAPLIVSVRSGAPVSMPGMLETLLNIGLCDATLPGLLRQTGNPRLVWDAYRRLIASFGEVVAGLPASLFEDEINLAAHGRDERQLDFSDLRNLTRRFLSIYQQNAGKPFPQDVNEQLSGAVRAVFASWEGEKAQDYRERHQIDAGMGTAVTIQAMVFGNAGGHSGAGVGFTRDPATGERRMWVDFLVNAQGEDVVSGRRNAHGHQVLASVAPDAWRKLEESAQTLEREFSDMQDFEFTVQDGKLHMLQTRSGKRTPLAAARIALDLMDEGAIDAATAVQRTSWLREQDIGVVRLAAQGAPQSPAAPVARAMAASPGVVSGEIALDGQRAAARANDADGASVILVRQDAETSDIDALESAAGLLTQRGARTSHAAVVARQLGKVCLVACETLRIDLTARTVSLGDMVLGEGDVVTLDGNDGSVYAGAMAVVMVPDRALLERLRQLRTPQAAGHHRKRRPTPAS